jgi:hypothetical protein
VSARARPLAGRRCNKEEKARPSPFASFALALPEVRRPGIVSPNCERFEESSRGERGAFERTAGGARRREGEAMGKKEREGEGEEREGEGEGRRSASEERPAQLSYELLELLEALLELSLQSFTPVGNCPQLERALAKLRSLHADIRRNMREATFTLES